MRFRAVDRILDELCRYLVHLDGDDLQRMVAPDVVALEADQRQQYASLLHLFPVFGRVSPIVATATVVPADPAECRNQAFQAIRHLFQEVCRDRFVVIWIDDCQWGDDESLALIQELWQPPNAPRALFIFCSSTPTASSFPRALTELASRLGIRELSLDLEGLEYDHALDVVFGSLRTPARQLNSLRELVRDCGGNPTLLKLLAKIAHGGAADLSKDWVGDQLHAMSMPEQAALRLAAVAGHPLTDATMRVLGIEDVTVRRLLDEGWLSRDQYASYSAVSVKNDRIRGRIVGTLDRATRASVHGRLADALAANREGTSLDLVSHYVAAERVDDAAAHALQRADVAAADSAFELAAQLYEWAFELRGAQPTDWNLLARCGVEFGRAGQGVRAGDKLEAAAEAASVSGLDDRASHLRADASAYYLSAGAFQRAERSLLETARRLHLDIESPNMWRAAVLKRLPWVVPRRIVASECELDAGVDARLDLLRRLAQGISLIDHTRYHEVALTWLREAVAAGEPNRIAQALGMEAVMQAIIGGSLRKSSLRLLRAAERMGESTPYGEASKHSWNGAVAFNRGDWQTCRDHCTKAEQILLRDSPNVVWEMNAVRTWLFGALAMLGEVGELNRRLPPLVRDARKRGDQLALDIFELSLCSLAALARDAPEEVDAAVQRVGQRVERGFSSAGYYRLAGFCFVRFYEGDYPAAWREIDRVWTSVTEARFLNLELLGVLLKYFRACAAVGNQSEPKIDEARRLRKSIGRAKVEVARPLAAAIQAEIDHLRGDDAGARRALAGATGDFAALGMNLFARAAERRLASLAGADPNQIGAIDSALTLQGVRNPAAFARALVVGN